MGSKTTPESMVELFAVQPRVDTSTYASEASYRAAVRAAAERIDERRERDDEGNPAQPALAVWPENMGVFLPLCGRAHLIERVETTEAALRKVALRMIPTLLRTAVRTRPRSMEEALFAALAPDVHRIHWTVFSETAREFGLWIVAGTVFVPRNRHGIDTAEFDPVDARTYNTAYTFAPDGRCVAVTRKQNLVPTQEDVLNLSSGDADDLPLVETPFGLLGTVICYDGFDEAHTEDEAHFRACGLELDARGADVLAQPSANAWEWDAPWVFNAPDEDLLRREQWFDEGMYTHLSRCRRVRYVVNPQIVGQILDNRFEAPSLVLARGDDADVAVLARSPDPYGADLLQVTVPNPMALQAGASSTD